LLSPSGEIVKKSAEALEGISESTKKVGNLVSEISAASSEQAQGVEEANKAVSQMDQVTQQNAANAEETASASEELNAQADSMDGVVADLSSLVNGTASGNNRPAKALPRASAVRKPIAAKRGKAPKTIKAEEVISFAEDDFKEL